MRAIFIVAYRCRFVLGVNPELYADRQLMEISSGFIQGIPKMLAEGRRTPKLNQNEAFDSLNLGRRL